MKLVSVLSIGVRTFSTLHGPSTSKSYPPNPLGELFDRLRRQLGLGIRATAEAAGLDPVEVYGLRQGRLAFASANDFADAVRNLVQAAEKVNPPRTAWATDMLAEQARLRALDDDP